MIESLSLAKEKMFGPREVVFSNGIKLTPVVNSLEPTLILRDRNYTVLDLKEFAPEGTIVLYDPKKKWSAITRDNSLKVPQKLQMGKVEEVSSIFDYLHECGHLQNSYISNNSISAENYYSQNFLAKPSTINDPNRIKALEQRNYAYLESERAAWAYSLRSVRNIQDRFGVDIVKKMGGTESVIKYVAKWLKTYQETTFTELEYLGFDTYSSVRATKEIFSKYATG